MTSFDLISMAVRNLWKRKLRTFLTVLGVIIGTASIIVMVSLGIGMNESFEAQLSQRGNLRVITVNAPGGGYYGGRGMTVMSSSSSVQNNKVSLDDKAVSAFKKIEGVEAVTPMVRGYFRFLVDKYVGDMNVVGIDPSTMEAFGYNLAQGRFLIDGDELSAVFGSHATEYNFYNPKMNWRVRWNNPVDIGNVMEIPKIQITYDNQYGEKRDTIPTETETKSKKPAKVYKLNVVGLLGGDGENSYSVFMPITQVQKLIKEQEKFEKEQYKQRGGSSNQQSQSAYSSIMVKCYDMDSVKIIQEQIKEMGFQTYSLTEDLEYMKETSKSMQALLGAIGAVSLLVAAIGITNTMVMSIYERTREIGVMKVIGASLKDIKRLFLVEAALIGFLGGLFGVGISVLISNIINSTGVQFLGMMSYGGAGKISSIPLWLCLLGLGFSALVGIVSGYFPARRAMNLSAISAIHTE